MRAYFFGNMYLSSIQQGIQAAHVVAEMFIKYNNPNGPGFFPVREWATDHKTMVLLNAGYSRELWSLQDFFTDDNPYPWAYFRESDDALDRAVTSIGIILPERIYKTSSDLRKGTINWTSEEIPADLTDWEVEMMDKLQQYGLAR